MVFGVQLACTFRVGVVRGLLGVFLRIMDFLRYTQSGDSKKPRVPEGGPCPEKHLSRNAQRYLKSQPYWLFLNVSWASILPIRASFFVGRGVAESG